MLDNKKMLDNKEMSYNNKTIDNKEMNYMMGFSIGRSTGKSANMDECIKNTLDKYNRGYKILVACSPGSVLRYIKEFRSYGYSCSITPVGIVISK